MSRVDFNNQEDLTRFTGSIQINHTPVPWFTHRLTIGTDEVREDNQTIRPEDEYFSLFSAANSFKSVFRRDASNNTVDYIGTFDVNIADDLTSSTSVGTQYHRRFTKFVEAFGEDLALPGIRAITAAATNSGSENYIEEKNVGVFVQQQFGYRDRLFLTLGLRADDNSAFGEEFDLVYYPKVSGAWVMSEEPFWRVPYIDMLRLRAAYGETGQPPGPFDALRTFTLTAGPGDVGTVTPGTVGNPDLGPERGSEIEFGFDGELINRRVGLEFSFYHARTMDAILVRSVAPSLGFPGSQFINVGEVRNQGFEVGLRTQPVESRDVSWGVTFNLANNTSKVIDLGLDEFGDPRETIVVAATEGVEHRIGHPIGSWFNVRLLSAELDDQGRHIKTTMMCEGLDGNPTPCYDGNMLVAPRVFIGPGIPQYEGSVGNSLTLFNRVRLYALTSAIFGNELADATFTQARFSVDSRNISPSEMRYVNGPEYGIYGRLSTARWSADNILEKLREWTDAEVPDRTRKIGQAAAHSAYSHLLLGEGFCSAAIDLSPELSRTEIFSRAEGKFTEAIQAAEAAGDNETLNMARIGLARTLLNLGRGADAAVLARQVPQGFEKMSDRSDAQPSRRNFIAWQMESNVSVARMYRNLTVDGVPDHRVASDSIGISAGVPLYRARKYPSRTTDMAIASWREAWLIIAEVEGGQEAVNRINDLRDHHDLPRFESSDPNEIRAQVIEERQRELFLESHNLFDLTRLEIPLFPAPGTTYPIEGDARGGVYADARCFPLPDVERLNNPNIP